MLTDRAFHSHTTSHAVAVAQRSTMMLKYVCKLCGEDFGGFPCEDLAQLHVAIIHSQTVSFLKWAL